MKPSIIKNNNIQNNTFNSLNAFANLLKDSKITIDSKNNTAKISGHDNNNSYCSVTIKNYQNGCVNTKSTFNCQDKKSNFKHDIISLYNNGYTQVEIAEMLPISQSYVSKLLKNR